MVRFCMNQDKLLQAFMQQAERLLASPLPVMSAVCRWQIVFFQVVGPGAQPL